MRTSWVYLLIVVGSACDNTSGAVISSVDGGAGTPLYPPGQVDCSQGPNYTGCPCQVGAMTPCYTGPASTRGVGGCKDGAQTCGVAGENSTPSYGACVGETVPTTANSCGVGSPDGGTTADGRRLHPVHHERRLPHQ